MKMKTPVKLTLFLRILDTMSIIQKTLLVSICFTKVLMHGKLFQRCKYFLYCSVLSLCGKVNTRRMLQPVMESISQKQSKKYSGHRKLVCEFSKLSKLNAFNLLGYQSNTGASILVYKHRPERMVSICTQIIRNSN